MFASTAWWMWLVLSLFIYVSVLNGCVYKSIYNYAIPISIEHHIINFMDLPKKWVTMNHPLYFASATTDFRIPILAKAFYTLFIFLSLVFQPRHCLDILKSSVKKWYSNRHLITPSYHDKLIHVTWKISKVFFGGASIVGIVKSILLEHFSSILYPHYVWLGIKQITCAKCLTHEDFKFHYTS